MVWEFANDKDSVSLTTEFGPSILSTAVDPPVQMKCDNTLVQFEGEETVTTTYFRHDNQVRV